MSHNQRKRKSKRLNVTTGIVQTPDGVCTIIDLNKKGLSFSCINRQYFAHEWTVDIFDTSGLSLEQLQVKRVWQKSVSKIDTPSPFPLKVGVEFKNFTPLQAAQLDFYIRKLEELKDNT